MSYYTYIATNSGKTVLYTGVTNNLSKRIFQHANKVTDGFTSRYNVNRVVWYDVFENIYNAIAAEKKIKGWSRAKKIDLIKSVNPDLSNLLNQEDSSSGSE
jgi:putative endonuclease